MPARQKHKLTLQQVWMLRRMAALGARPTRLMREFHIPKDIVRAILDGDLYGDIPRTVAMPDNQLQEK